MTGVIPLLMGKKLQRGVSVLSGLQHKGELASSPVLSDKVARFESEVVAVKEDGSAKAVCPQPVVTLGNSSLLL